MDILDVAVIGVCIPGVGRCGYLDIIQRIHAPEIGQKFFKLIQNGILVLVDGLLENRIILAVDG